MPSGRPLPYHSDPHSRYAAPRLHAGPLSSEHGSFRSSKSQFWSKGKNTNADTKQSRVIAMLQSPAGATIAGMMQATGWQQHSVRGFLAGVVRKRLKLKLESKKVDDSRVYQIAKDAGRKSKPRPSKRQSS